MSTAIEIKVPPLPESVADATIVTWHKQPGDQVKRDENLVDLETEKVVLEVPSPMDGILSEILKPVGASVSSDEVLGVFIPQDATHAIQASATAKPTAMTTAQTKPEAKPEVSKSSPATATTEAPLTLTPSMRRRAQEQVLSPQDRVIKESTTQQISAQSLQSSAQLPQTATHLSQYERLEKRVPMTRLRARIAERLVQAQHNAAMLTTFNEVNLQVVMDLRRRHQEMFEKKHGVRLGFMSFFTKAVIEALKSYPDVNASIDGNDMVYHAYFDIGIAVSTDRGLVVPILRDADQLSMAEIERKIGEFAARARDGKLSIDEMTGGTFTITNGGIFGSLLSTPILNPPQSGILGMHKIEQRPIVENNEIVIRPMMYLALTYDHRIVDGRESVRFLAKVKEFLEDPSRLLLEV